MAKKTNTRSALISSMLSLFLCCTMLLGTTYAWFTDSVTSSGNKIMSGSLLVDLELLDKAGRGWHSIKTDAKPLFYNDLWEPGYTEIKLLKVENEGSLALKWKARFSSKKELSILSDVIDVYVCAYGGLNDADAAGLSYPTTRNLDGYVKVGTLREFVSTIEDTTNGTLEAGQSAYLGLALKMRESAGNEYQNLDLGGVFDIQILAAQCTAEDDSFDDQYDADAEYPAPVDPIVGTGVTGGVVWTLTESGVLTISPTDTPAPDPDSGATYEVGAWREAVVYDKNGNAKAIGGYPYDVNAVTSLVINEGVTSIGSFTAKFPNLTGEVVIPASVTYIGQEAFQNAPITKLTFASGGTEELCIAPGAFKKMQVEEIVLPADRPAIHLHCWAFNDNTKLKSVTIPDNVTTFSGWTHVEYCGMSYTSGYDSQLFARCYALETLIFDSQDVHDRFFGASGNSSNINAIGDVEIIVNN